MANLDLTALATELPPNTNVVANVAGNSLVIGSFFETSLNAEPWTKDLDSDSPEQAVARAYFTSALQQSMGDDYAVAQANGTLPTWSPGAALPEVAPASE